MHRGRACRPARGHRPRRLHVRAPCRVQARADRFAVDELQRVRVAGERAIELDRRHHEIRLGLAVGVVVEALPQYPQLLQVGRRQSKPGSQFPRTAVQVIAERRDHGPGAEASVQVQVHEDAGAHAARGIDVRLEKRVPRDLARVVVVEIAHLGTAPEQFQQRRAVAIERHVEHGHAVARARRHAREQRDVALYPGDELGLGRFREAQLVQRADAVRVAVEYVVEPHGAAV